MKNTGLLVIILVLIVSTLAFAYLWTTSAKEVVHKAAPGLAYVNPDIFLDKFGENGKEQEETGDAVYVKSLKGFKASAVDGVISYSGTAVIVNEQTIPIEGIEVEIQAEYGEQTELSRLVTNKDGEVAFQFEFPEDMDWKIEVRDVIGEGIRYAPELNNIKLLEGLHE